MPDTLHWDTRLEARFDGETIAPLDSISFTRNIPVQPLHTVSEDNFGYIVSPATTTITFTVKAIGPVVAKLTELAVRKAKITIAIMEKRGTDWTRKSVAFNECLIQSGSETIGIDGAPAMTFTAIALDVVEEAK